MAARARPCAVRTRLFELIATPNRCCAPHPPIAASLLLILPPKINKIYRTWAARVKGFPENKCFSSSSNLGRPCQGIFPFPWISEAMKYEVLFPPSMPNAASLILLAVGSKLCTGATIRPNFFRFFLFLYSFLSFLFVILSFLISSYSSLLILLFLSHLVLFFVFFYFSSYILYCLLYSRHAY
jgi:hypothetical protein